MNLWRAQEGAQVRQTNEGKWKFTMSDSGAALVLDVVVGQHLDTSELDIDIQPSFVRLLIKVCEVRPPFVLSTCCAQRSGAWQIVAESHCILKQRFVL